MMKVIRVLARVFLGLIFIFSGFVKAVDPLGTTYKLLDYFEAFQIGFLSFFAFPLSILLNGAEFLIGIALLIGLRMRLTSWVTLIFMSFFLVLTFIIALTNPVTDCGCFGDALVLSNWQTFWKNVLFMGFALIIFFSGNKYRNAYNAPTEWMLVTVTAVFIVGISIYSYRHLPLIDFRPYKVGSYLPEKMEFPEGAKPDKYIYNYTLKNTNTGEIKEMTSDEYLESKIWEDTAWEIIETSDPILIEKGYEPPIHDFDIVSLEGENVTDKILYSSRYTFLLVNYKVQKASMEGLVKANEIAAFASEQGYEFYAVTSSLEEIIKQIKDSLGLEYDFYTGDEIMLKTVIRSNPGLVLIKDGVVIDKWHHNDFPGKDELKENMLSYSLSRHIESIESLRIINLILYALLFFALFKYIRNLMGIKNEYTEAETSSMSKIGDKEK
ncbi:MAG: BT_3928 family protein [bacterium]